MKIFETQRMFFKEPFYDLFIFAYVLQKKQTGEEPCKNKVEIRKLLPENYETCQTE